jgi:FdhE protein
VTKGLPVLAGGIPADVPYVCLPRTDVLFARRAARLRELANGHAAHEWLSAMAALAEAQDAARACAAWLPALGVILDRMGLAPLPAPARAACAQLRTADRGRAAAWADALLCEDPEKRPPPGVVPFLTAALQVERAAFAARQSAAEIARALRDCPVCRAPAVAAIVRGDDRVRYLHCAMCGSAWHRTRIVCVTCGEPGGLSYFGIDGVPGVKAEACSACRTYLKLFYEEERPGAEPIADDLATIALDLMLGEEGLARGGTNTLLAL